MCVQTMAISDIKISQTFQRTMPKAYKMEKCRCFWEKYQTQDRYIIVDADNVLLDGYIMYLVLQEYGKQTAEVKKVTTTYHLPAMSKTPTTYVYGKHIHDDNSLSSKEYVWRIPKMKFYAGWGDELNIGDKVMVVARDKIVPIVITRLVTTTQSPFSSSVKTVIRKCKG